MASSIAGVDDAGPGLIDKTIEKAVAAFRAWRLVPAPRRGELVRLLGAELRAAKDDLGRLVTHRSRQDRRRRPRRSAGDDRYLRFRGRPLAPALRPHHRQRTPGASHDGAMASARPVGVITAFNFPVAVWAWNAALALVCGDPVIWKPSEKTPLTALAVQALFARAAQKFGDAPEGLSAVLIGERASRRRAGRRSASAARLGHRIDRDGSRASAESWRSVWPRDPGARRQQCRHRLPFGRSRSGAARDRVRRHRHCRAALHHACGGCSCTRVSTTRSSSGCKQRLRVRRRSAIRWRTIPFWSGR